MSVLTPEDHAFYAENGYVIIHDAVPKENCDAVIDAIWKFLGMYPNNSEDWYREPLRTGGMVEMYQHQAMWNNRQAPRIHQAFTELFGTEKLWVSIDRVNFKPPRHPDHPEYDHKGGIHWDLDVKKRPLPFMVQGVLYLADTTADQGGFRCVPGIHRGLEAWLDSLPPDTNPLADLPSVPIPGKAGDFLIWNSLLAHGNGQNVSDKPRFAQFISMNPVKAINEEWRSHRIHCWKNHCPPGDKVFPGDPRHIEEEYGTTAELTPLGRKLLGVDLWE